MAVESSLLNFISRRLYDNDSVLSIWGKSILQSYKQVSRLSFLPPVTWMGERQCIVFGSRIYGKLGARGRSESHVTMSARDLLRMPGLPGSFSYDLQAYASVCDAVVKHEFDALEKLKSRVEKTLRVVRPRIFVANSTIDPINRLWILAAKEFGAKVVCLQHGVYSQVIPDYAQEDNIVDSYIALDESQKEIVARNVDSKRILVLGKRSRFKWIAPGKSISVCFVGEDWERYGYVDLKQMIVSRYREIAGALSANGVSSIWYKPHPSENQMFGVNNEVGILTNRDIELPHVYIGFSSSLLKDVSSQGKLAIQILEPQTNADCFQSNGYCLSVKNDSDLISNILEIIKHDQTQPCVLDQGLEGLLGLQEN